MPVIKDATLNPIPVKVTVFEVRIIEISSDRQYVLIRAELNKNEEIYDSFSGLSWKTKEIEIRSYIVKEKRLI